MSIDMPGERFEEHDDRSVGVRELIDPDAGEGTGVVADGNGEDYLPDLPELEDETVTTAEPVGRHDATEPAEGSAGPWSGRPRAAEQDETVDRPHAAQHARPMDAEHEQPVRARPVANAEVPRTAPPVAADRTQTERPAQQTRVAEEATRRPVEHADRAEAATATAKPEGVRIAKHEHMDWVVRQALANNGEIPGNIQMEPAERAIVQAAVTIVYDNLDRLMPGAPAARSQVVRVMPSDQSVVESARKGMNWATAVTVHRALELTAEDPRAKLARETAHHLTQGTGTAPVSQGPSDLERVATSIARQLYGPEFSDVRAEQLAPLVAGYAVELAGARMNAEPAVVAATVLGFGHSCDVARSNLRSIPEALVRLRTRTQQVLGESLDQARGEFGAGRPRARGAGETARQAEARVRSLVTIGCSNVGMAHAQFMSSERHKAIEAAKAAEQAQQRQEAVARRRQEISTQNRQSSLDYNMIAARDGDTILRNIMLARATHDWPAVSQRMAVLIEQAQLGLPDSDAHLEYLWEQNEVMLTNYVYSMRAQILEGEVPPDVALFIDNLNPEAMNPGEAERANVVLDALERRAAASYRAENREYTAEEWAAMRTGYVVARLNDQARAAWEAFTEAGNTEMATQVNNLFNSRLQYLVDTVPNFDPANSNLPATLQNQITAALERLSRLPRPEPQREPTTGAGRLFRRAMDGLRRFDGVTRAGN